MITAEKQYCMSLFVSAIEKAKNKQSIMDLPPSSHRKNTQNFLIVSGTLHYNVTSLVLPREESMILSSILLGVAGRTEILNP
jgi:hypothetical protein